MPLASTRALLYAEKRTSSLPWGAKETMPAHPTTSRTPWPCGQCGLATGPRAGAGTAAWEARVALLAGGGICLGALLRGPVLPAPGLVGVLVVLLLLARWGNHRKAARAWRCGHCGHQERARLHPARPLRVLLAIPAHNDAETIYGAVERARRTCPTLPLVVVNDCSDDLTAQRARTAAATTPAYAPFKLLHHSHPSGRGQAVATALEFGLAAGFSHVAVLDGSGRDCPEDVLPLLGALCRQPEVIWVAERARALPGPAWMVALWESIRARAGMGPGLTASRLRVYPTASTLSLGVNPSSARFEGDLLIRAARAGLVVGEVSLAGGSPMSDRSPWRETLEAGWFHGRLGLGIALQGFRWWPRLRAGKSGDYPGAVAASTRV